MKAETLLDSVVFQLTPTRTRYDLLIIANGKTEKIASGLLDPFLAHLKTAEDQIAKGGYSIRLEPDPGTDTAWFTKDTVQRFVRFVSTPEVLDRVNTLESEILQINEAIAIQGTDHLCSSIVEDHQGRCSGSIYGGKYSYSTDKEKAMVLTKYGKLRRLSTGSTTQEMNSRRQLLRVLESRKNVLRKEQGMAFARAVAAGFDMDHMAYLILFAKSFGASRLLEACLKFVHLWKATHKNGQWLEVVRADTGKASGIMFYGDDWKQKQSTDTWLVSKDYLATESNEKNNYTAAPNMISQQLNSDDTEDRRPISDSQALFGPQYYHGQIQNPMIPHWATHCPPVSQSFPMQVMPYYHSYPTPYSMDNKISNVESNSLEMDFSNAMSQVEVDQYQMKLRKKKSLKKAGHSGESASQSEEEIQNLHSNLAFRNSSRSENNNEGAALMKTSNVVDNDQIPNAVEGDAGNWQTFQNLLLKIQSESNANAVNNSNEEPQQRRRLYRTQEDPSVPPARDSYKLSNPNFENGSQNAYTDSHKSSLYDVRDKSFVVPSRPGLHDEQLMKEKRRAVNVNYDFSSSLPKNNDKSINIPHDLSLIPDRVLEKGLKFFDTAKDFDVQNGSKKETRIQDPLKIAREGLKGLGKERKSGSVPYGLEKRKMDAMTMKGKSSKLKPLADAKARVEKLQAFKADIQKVKKEKEEEERRRLEALKLERQKRIAARSTSNNVQAAQTKAKIPPKHLPSSSNSSKFSDAAPTSFSPLHKLQRSSMNSPQSTLKPKQILTTHSSSNSYKVSKFCDTEPATLPLLKLLSRGKNVVQSIARSPETALQKTTRLYPSASPIKKLPSISSKFGEIAPSSSSGWRRSPTPISSLKGEIKGNIPMKRVSIPEGSKTHRSSPLRSPASTREPKKTISKESQQKSKPAIFPESKVRTRREPSCDDDLIVEKAVVILENKTITAPIIRDSKAMSNVHASSPALRVSPTMLTAGGAYNSDECKSVKKPGSYQGVEHIVESVQQKMPKAHVCSSVNSIAPGKVHEMNKNTRSRGSPGGFKELLKFRRQATSSSSRELNNANSTVTAASPNKVPTLQDLFAKDSH